jgi:hypothetical protein
MLWILLVHQSIATTLPVAGVAVLSPPLESCPHSGALVA